LEPPALRAATRPKRAVIRVARREAAECWSPPSGQVVITTSSIGFAGAAEDDRQRWLNGFRRLLDGLDAPIQVVIDVKPGPDEDGPIATPTPSRFEDMRGADMCFAEQIRRFRSSHSVTTSLITTVERAARLLDANAGASDPTLAGALPNAEDLQRRLASSQDKAYHVAVYLTLTSPTTIELELGSRRVEAAARAILCELQPCTFRMLDGLIATRPGGADRLQRRRVLDSTALITFFPWLEPDLQQPGGLFIGRNGATGAPVLVDPFDQRSYANANIAV